MFSFDIFDTLITRDTECPEDIFELMGETLPDKYLQNNSKLNCDFKKTRMQAELVARTLYNKGDIEDITLEQIYATMSSMGVISKSDEEFFCALEKKIELEHIHPIQENIDKIKMLLTAGEQVIAISDMYHDAKFLLELLMKAGCPEIKIYVSSEVKKCKWTGNIYRYLCSKEHFQYDNWKHMGDNEKSDYQIPKKLGIDAILYRNDNIKYYVPQMVDISEYQWIWKKNCKKIDSVDYRRAIKTDEIAVAIYGAGNIGLLVKRKLEKEHKIVIWVDRWYEECQSRGLEVQSPDLLNVIKWDVVVVAIAREEAASEIIEHLIDRGIEEKKIVWMDS